MTIEAPEDLRRCQDDAEDGIGVLELEYLAGVVEANCMFLIGARGGIGCYLDGLSMPRVETKGGIDSKITSRQDIYG